MNKLILLFNIFLFFLLSACSPSQPKALKSVQMTTSDKQSSSQSDTKPNASGILKVMTLNLAHGRKDGFNQIFQSKSKIKKNLADIPK